VMDMAGKLVINHQVNVRGKGQLSEINLPAGLNAGTYVVKVSNEANNISKSVKLIVE